MNERLKIIEESIKHDLVHNHGMMVNVTCMDMEWLIDTIKNQQATIDSLSMAHDEMHRWLPKDKHTLIKNIIALNREAKELEESHLRNVKGMQYKLNKLEKENDKLQKTVFELNNEARELHFMKESYLKLLEMVIDNGQCSSINFITDKLAELGE